MTPVAVQEGIPVVKALIVQLRYRTLRVVRHRAKVEGIAVDINLDCLINNRVIAALASDVHIHVVAVHVAVVLVVDLPLVEVIHGVVESTVCRSSFRHLL